jgi:hypothetical protein
MLLRKAIKSVLLNKRIIAIVFGLLIIFLFSLIFSVVSYNSGPVRGNPTVESRDLMQSFPSA